MAALEAGHPHHPLARPYLEAAHGGGRALLVAAHALAETFSVLTVLPVSPRISPPEAERLLRESVLQVATVVTLDADDYGKAIERMATLGLISGAIYDALHVRAAEKGEAAELVTFNGRDPPYAAGPALPSRRSIATA